MRVIAPVLIFASLCAAQSTGSVTGSVVDRVTGAGISGVVVVVYTRQAVLYETTSDLSGNFQVFGMKPGDYEIRFEKEGYDRTATRIPPQPYKVGQGQDPVRIRLELTRHVSFSGRVLDPEGNPISQGTVRLGNFKVPVSADGTFTVKDLVPGSYSLSAIPNATRVPEGARVPVITEASEPVVIRGDVDVSGYEIRLQTAEVFRISGVVMDEAGNPKPKVAIQLRPRIQSETSVYGSGEFMIFIGPGPNVGGEEARAVSAADGSFEFPQVRSGEWQLAGVSSGPIDSVDEIKNFHSGGLSVVVADRSVENLQLRQAPSFPISGTIDWGDAPRGLRTTVGLRSADGRIAASLPLFTQPDGTIAPSMITPGQYLIVPQAGPGFYPVSVLLGAQEVLGKPVDLFPGATFRISYKAATGSVHGTVNNCNGASVVLIPKDVRTVAFGRAAPCRADGGFDLNGVAPGDYSAVVLHGVDLQLLPKFASAGVGVSVGQNAVSVQLNVSPSQE